MKNDLNCVVMKRALQARIRRATRGMTAEEEIAYLRREAETGPFAELHRATCVIPSPARKSRIAS